MKATLTYQNLSARPGEKVSGYTQIPGGEKLPVTVINGAKEGKTLLISAGIHGGEYPGIQTAVELAAEIDPRQVSGQVVIIHCVNMSGFFARVSYISPLDGKNLNRLFPGDENGSRGDKTVYFITENYIKKADFYLDLHGGDIHEKLPPYVYRPGVGENEAALETAYEGAKLISAKYMVKSSATTGAYNRRAVLGIPALLVERGFGGKWSRREVDDYKADVINIMRWMGILPGKAKLPRQKAAEICDTVYLDADADGLWYPLAEVDRQVKKGEKIGRICDIFGNVLKEYYAEFDRVVLYAATSLAIEKGTAIITYGA